MLGLTCTDGNGRNDYAEFSHEGHQARATHYGNGRNDCAESSHDNSRNTHNGNGRNDCGIFTRKPQLAQHTTATAATIMRNFHTKATKLAQHTTAMAATIVLNLHTMVPPKLAQHTQRQRPQRLCGIFAR